MAEDILPSQDGVDQNQLASVSKTALSITSKDQTRDHTQSSGGFFYSIGSPFRRAGRAIKEWRSLQRNIRYVSAAIRKNEWEVLESLNNYRLTVSAVSFKPAKLDQEIWTTYESIREETPTLKATTMKRPLYLRGAKTLRQINAQWEALHAMQNGLLETLAKAPKSVEFYNRIHLARVKKREQELHDAELSKRNAQAKESIEKALSKLGVSTGPIGHPGLASGILKLDDAKNYWTTRLAEVSNLETSAIMDPEEVVSIYRNIEATILDAPRMAEQVKEVEVQFTRMITMHEELASYGKNVIPSEDLARMFLKVQQEIPKLWATGSWDKLRRELNEVSSFVKFYEMPVRSELSQAERRKPGLTRALIAGTSSLPLNQVTSIVRGLVSAIDARDQFMRGHSDAVARVALQIAKKMNWSPEDLEYLEIASLLHDVGKVVIPENLLTKIDPLSPDDWRTIQTHPYHGAQIVKNIEPLNKIAPWIYHHQERWDGTGYPDKISDKSIPVAARIIAVCEAFTAMTASSPKRKGLSLDQAVNEITLGAGSQFDPDVAGALVQTVENTDPKFLLAN